jgi:hypothetical protein
MIQPKSNNTDKIFGHFPVMFTVLNKGLKWEEKKKIPIQIPNITLNRQPKFEYVDKNSDIKGCPYTN